MDQQVEMRKLLADWKRSGLSLRELGRRKGIAYAKLLYWRRKLQREKSEREAPAAGISAERWLPVRVVPSPVESPEGKAGYEVRLANGIRIGVTDGFEGKELTRLVQVLASC
jgi:transposase-like protein